MERKGTSSGKTRAPLGEIFTRHFLLLATINLCMFFGFQMLNIGLPVYMAQLGAAGQVVGLATTLMTVTATLMRVFAGALLDRFGRWGLLIGGTVIMVCAIVSFAIFPIVGVILGLRMLHGIGWGMGSTATSTIAADIIPKRRFAEGMGYFALTTAISSAIAPAASIEIIQGAGAHYMIYVAAGVTVLALLLSAVEAFASRQKGVSPEAAG
jgi:MFS family permease